MMTIGALASLLLAALQPAPPSADPPARPSRYRPAVDQFTSACFDGAMRTATPPREIQPAELPSALRRHYRQSMSGRYYEVGARRPSYLMVLTVNDPAATFSSICALAVPGQNVGGLFASVTDRLGVRWGPAPGITLSATTDNIADGYAVSAIIVGGYVLLEVSHYAGGGVRDSKPPAPAR